MKDRIKKVAAYIFRDFGMPNSAAEVARDVRDIINDVLEGDLICLAEKR